MTKHLNIKIIGHVQGVGFRFSSYEKFVDLGLMGRAENLPDRSVFVDVEGPEEQLQAFVEWSQKGPNGAKVDKVEVTEISEPFVPVKNS